MLDMTLLGVVPGSLTSWIVWSIAPSGMQGGEEVDVGTDRKLILDIDMPSRGYKYLNVFLKNMSNTYTLNVEIYETSWDGTMEYPKDTASIAPGDVLEIFYIHPMRYRIYAYYSNGSGKVDVKYRVWR